MSQELLEMLMKVLYAHMRAVSIIKFCLNPSFIMLEEFCTYFNMYWSYKIVDIQQFDPRLQEVGHPSRHLERIRYLGWDGGSTREQSVQLWRLWNSSQDWCVEVDGPICRHDEQTTSYPSSTEENWSSVDVDAPGVGSALVYACVTWKVMKVVQTVQVTDGETDTCWYASKI